MDPNDESRPITSTDLPALDERLCKPGLAEAAHLHDFSQVALDLLDAAMRASYRDLGEPVPEGRVSRRELAAFVGRIDPELASAFAHVYRALGILHHVTCPRIQAALGEDAEAAHARVVVTA